MSAPRVMFGLPTYGGLRYNLTSVINALAEPGPFKVQSVNEIDSSLLANAFNSLWVRALNFRDTDNLTHFLLMHADIVPQQRRWLATMWEEMDRVGADVLSVVSPIKDERGLTTTGVDTNPVNVWGPRRYTLAEVHAMEPTFTHERLVVNTGLLLVDMRKPWVEKVYFSIRDVVWKDPEHGWRNATEPEDWRFSRLARENGAKVYATRAVPIHHVGGKRYVSDTVWGTWQDEQGDDIHTKFSAAT